MGKSLKKERLRLIRPGPGPKVTAMEEIEGAEDGVKEGVSIEYGSKTKPGKS
jgi:hypothetical protein